MVQHGYGETGKRRGGAQAGFGAIEDPPCWKEEVPRDRIAVSMPNVCRQNPNSDEVDKQVVYGAYTLPSAISPQSDLPTASSSRVQPFHRKRALGVFLDGGDELGGEGVGAEGSGGYAQRGGTVRRTRRVNRPGLSRSRVVAFSRV